MRVATVVQCTISMNELKLVRQFYNFVRNIDLPDLLHDVTPFDATVRSVKISQYFIVDTSSVRTSFIELSSLWLYLS